MKIEKKTVEVRWLTGAELGTYLDLSPGRISQLTSDGILERRDGDGLYDLEHCLGIYSKYILAPHIWDRRY
jgi:hypothetical protein